MHVVATAGHVDHGKSTLLKALTGMEPDRWEQERQRGLSIDLGFVWTDLAAPNGDGSLTVAFVDVPGHERFVVNMLAGAGGVRLALFVVAADDGWSAQSQEHLDILHLLDVSAAVVAVTKTGLTGQDRALSVAADVEERLVGTSLASAPVILVDSVSGHGVGEVAATLAARLADAPAVDDHGRPRLWIDRAFTISGAGTVVTGTLTGGRLSAGDEVALLPHGRLVRVRGLQRLGEDTAEAGPGTRLAVNLAGIDHDRISRGDAVVGITRSTPSGTATGNGPLELWRDTDQVDARVRALPGHEIGRTGAWHLHAGSADTTVTLHPTLNEPAVAGNPVHMRLELERPLPLVVGDRFVLRESGRQATLGGGVVLDPDPPPRPRGTDERLDRDGALDAIGGAGDRVARLAALIAAAGGARPTRRACAAGDLLPNDLPLSSPGSRVGAELGEHDPGERHRSRSGHDDRDAPGTARLISVGGYLLTVAAYERWTNAALADARAHHEDRSENRGIGRDALTAAVSGAGCPPAVASALIDHLADVGRLRRRASTYILPEYVADVDAARDQRRERLLEALRAEPFAPPPLDEVADAAGVSHEEVTALVHEGAVVDCGAVAFAADAIDEAERRLRDLTGDRERFTTAEAREALDTSRKYAIPLLEHLDAIGVTEFDGQTRQLRRAH